MPYCPKCRDEFRPGFTWCPYCQMPLVEALPPETEPLPLEPVPLLTVENNTQLALISGLLDEAQIPFYTQDEGGGAYLRLVMGFSVYDQTIYVNKPDYERARACLDAYYFPAPDEQIFTLTDEEEAAGAAAQRRENGSYRGFLWFLAAFAVLALLLWMAAGEY